MENLLDKFKGTKEPEQELVQDPFALEINIHFGIRLIQKNDRGRQGINRLSQIQRKIEEHLIAKELEKRAKEGKAQKESQENKDNKASLFIQKRIRGILARKNVERLRADEMEFLGMVRKKKTEEEMRSDPIKKMEDTRKERKMVQDANWKKYLDAKEALKDEIIDNEGIDIQENMLKDRRDWINEKMELELNKIPEDITKFYERFKVEDPPPSNDEEAARK